MKQVRIKICGIKTVSMAQEAAAAGACAIGLNFVAASPRCVQTEAAREIVAALPAFVEPVGLFADAPTERVIDLAKSLGLRTIQLHGRETVSYGQYLAPLRIIKALPFDEHLENQVRQWQNHCANLAAILIDAPPPVPRLPRPPRPPRTSPEIPLDRSSEVLSGKDSVSLSEVRSNPTYRQGETLTGGSGRVIDWRRLALMRQADWPALILAGGLTPMNVANAIEQVHPYAVDVASGVESRRAVKDVALIYAFCDAVHHACLS